MVFYHTGGGGGVGSARVVKKPDCFLEERKTFFSEGMKNHSRTPKTCCTLGLECLSHIYSYKDSFERSLRGPNPGKMEGQNQRTKKSNFGMGPNVKFVSPICDLIFEEEKNGDKFFYPQFFFRK